MSIAPIVTPSTPAIALRSISGGTTTLILTDELSEDAAAPATVPVAVALVVLVGDGVMVAALELMLECTDDSSDDMELATLAAAEVSDLAALDASEARELAMLDASETTDVAWGTWMIEWLGRSLKESRRTCLAIDLVNTQCVCGIVRRTARLEAGSSLIEERARCANARKVPAIRT